MTFMVIPRQLVDIDSPVKANTVSMMKLNRLTDLLKRSRSALLLLLAVFLIAQVAWWVIFQIRVDKRLTLAQHELWDQQIELTSRFIDVHYRGNPEAASFWLNSTYPDLALSSDGHVVVRPEAHTRLMEETRKAVRMFAYEGGFFSLIVLLGIGYMYWTLRREILVERQQANFLAAITHELKTPVTAIKLLHENLEHADLQEAQTVEVNEAIHQNLDRLHQLIERLLLARSLTYNKPRDLSGNTDLCAVTTRVVQQYLQRLPAERAADIQYSKAEGCFARITPEFWEIVVINLLENALKYSKTGQKIQVALKAEEKHAKLSVKDMGTGFSRSEHRVIFNRFYRVGNEDTRSTEGIGLGLYLVREIVHSFKGAIDGQSEGPGMGAEFIVTLPLLRESLRG